MIENQDQDIIKDALLFALNRNFAVLSRNLLGILEQLKKNHQVNFDKLYDNLPESARLIEMADYFDNSHYDYFRKLVLDATNSCKRDLEFTIKDS